MTAEPTQKPSSSKTPLLIALFAILVLATGGVLFFIFAQLTADNTTVTLPEIDVNSNGVTPITPPRQVDDFTLTTHTGEPASLSNFYGNPIVLYFGYTHCPDVCPLTLLEFKRAHELLGENADNVTFIFASVDGERDTAEWLARYFETRRVEDFMIGMTGTEQDLRRIGVDYGLFFEKQTNTGSQADYIVDHTASSFLIDPEGNLSAILSFGTEPSVIVEELEKFF